MTHSVEVGTKLREKIRETENERERESESETVKEKENGKNKMVGSMCKKRQRESKKRISFSSSFIWMKDNFCHNREIPP